MKIKISFFIMLSLLPFVIYSQCTMANYLTAFRIPSNGYPYFSASSGVTVSATTINVPTLSNVSYLCGGNNYAGSTPAWWLNSATGIITLNFSAAVTNLTFLVNGTNSTEVFYITSNTGANTLSNFCSVGYTSVGGTLTAGATAGLGSLITVNNPIGATQYIMTHNGLGSGSRVTLLDCFVALVPLPIELISFSGSCDGKNEVNLEWKTLSEKANDYFTIERSIDAINWQPIGRVEGAGTTSASHSYSFIDKKPMKGSVYYHLMQTDFNKLSTKSNLISVNNCSESNTDDVIIYPNPSTQDFIISGKDIDSYKLFDGLGIEVKNKKIINSDDLILKAFDLPQGVYSLKIREKIYKIIKE